MHYRVAQHEKSVAGLLPGKHRVSGPSVSAIRAHVPTKCAASACSTALQAAYAGEQSAVTGAAVEAGMPYSARSMKS